MFFIHETCITGFNKLIFLWGFYICIHERYWPVILFSCNDLTGVGVRIILSSLNDLEVFLFSLFSEFVYVCYTIFLKSLEKFTNKASHLGLKSSLWENFKYILDLFFIDWGLFRIFFSSWKKCFSRNVSISSKLSSLLRKFFPLISFYDVFHNVSKICSDTSFFICFLFSLISLTRSYQLY